MDCGPHDSRFLAILESDPLLRQRLSPESLQILENSSSDPSTYLDTLTRISLESAFTQHVLIHYQSLFPELVARWRSLGTVEKVAAAFARVLPVASWLAESAEYFLLLDKNGPCRFGLDYWSRIDTDTAREVLLAVWRMLRWRRERFLKLVDAKGISALLQAQDRAVRWLAVRILAIVVGSSEKAMQEMLTKFGVGREDERVTGIWEDEEVDYGFLTVLESKRLKALKAKIDEAQILENDSMRSRVLEVKTWSPMIADMCGVLMPRLRETRPGAISIVDTPTTRENIYALANSLRYPTPLLVTGHTGAGKTSLIHQIADSLGALDTMVSIHLGDQTDAKMLIGTYSTAVDCPGSFEWRPGVLATAVREGRWVLVEDIDKAPTEVLGVLLPLIERGELLLPSRGERVQAARGFRLIATVRTAESRKSKDNEPSTITLLGNRLWNRVEVKMPGLDELQTIVRGRFPLLHTIAASIVSVYTTVRDLYKEPAFFALSKSTMGRQMSPRDVFKWCTRMNILFHDAGVKETSTTLPDALFDKIFREAVDCFAGNLHTAEARRLVAERIAEELHIPTARLDHFIGGETPAFRDAERSVTVGRAKLKKKKDSAQAATKRRKKTFSGGKKKRPFAQTAHALKLMEQIGVAVRLAEPVLLVGETGTGKTTIVQHLADLMGFGMIAINLSQQTESGDLLGGYKPVDVRSLAVPLKETFDRLFSSTFSAKKNARFIEVFEKCWGKQQWPKIIKLWLSAVDMAERSLAAEDEKEAAEQQQQEQPTKKRKLDRNERAAKKAQWIQFSQGVRTLERQSSQLAKSFAFSFVEGALVKAARNGDWVLLDEINLAAPDTLESIADLLKDGGEGSIILSEKGDVERIKAHPDFRIFACMNPATDVGKRDLPPSIRSRFTELYVTNPDADFDNLLAIINEYIGHLAIGDERIVSEVAELYMEAKRLSDAHMLVDGANQRPHFSIRTLTRTLSYVVEIAGVYGLRRSLYEGFCMSFLTILDRKSEEVLLPVIDRKILAPQKNVRSLIKQIPPRPMDGEEYVQFEHYWMRKGAGEPQEQAHYIITPFVKRNMLNLVRATATRKFPVLIQGPTSAGKTSMIEYLAKKTGNEFVRINNHEHTDLQEYMGTYVSDNDGQLSFREGVLVEALRKGHWIVLDELNLAPTDVLEALNRLLDDNRELLIPETNEVVRPHRNFMLFATQNPPGLYGGRKNLSRAFRNRFLELHFDDIPENELGTILKERCQIAPSYCERIVKVYKELSLLRQSTRLFEQKNSFATLRDLFRWANRDAVGYQQLAENGYMLLAERVRKDEEKLAVKGVLEKVMRVTINETELYMADRIPEPYSQYLTATQNGDVVWTEAMQRLFALVANAVVNQEPVLLVGETGCGKTTVCQMLADARETTLTIVNAHQNTETGDIIGAQRPKRNRSGHQKELADDLRLVLREFGVDTEEMDLKGLQEAYVLLEDDQMAKVPEQIKIRIEANAAQVKGLFEWADGPLIHSMKNGTFFLLDEISLADDSVLERLNSVLEPERTILLAEKGPIESQIKGTDGFQFLATMNPGGDYGKKELSPALRNRFTEIWVPAMTRFDDVLQIVKSKLLPSLQDVAEPVVRYSQWFAQVFRAPGSASEMPVVSIRDILAWTRFINLHGEANAALGLLHGAALVYFDGLGANPSAVLTMSEDVGQQKAKCVAKLSELVGHDLRPLYETPVTVQQTDAAVQVGPFSISRAVAPTKPLSFNLTAPTTAMNAMRVIRAMQLRRPILLEGSPGVGKTSLITALAHATGNPLTRINLSEQTDLMDLFGSDVPVEGGQSGEFAWRDAPFLRAMQKGHWVLLDEMNLASQSVLEGLNACLDHRGEAYIAELDRTFKCHPDFVVFAAQNPHHQGGGRKGLPASFVNRFTVVYVEALTFGDLTMIAERLYPTADSATVEKLIRFVVDLDRELTIKHSFGTMGGPWEFNLRDTLRWLELLTAKEVLPESKTPEEFIEIIIKQRFRTKEDRKRVDQLFAASFGQIPQKRQMFYQLTDDTFQVGHTVLPRAGKLKHVDVDELTVLKSQLPVLETVMTCVAKNMPAILVGASGVGKSCVIRLLAGLLGVEVETLALNNDVDTTDIVGGFEQVDMARKVAAVIVNVERLARKLIVEAVQAGGHPAEALLSLMDVCWNTDTQSDIERLTLLMQYLRDTVAVSAAMFDSHIETVERLLSEAHQAKAARFEWVDGALIKAVEEGRWLILDNANLCSPSVLDRLNSLLEVGGYLAVNEHSTPSGDPKIVIPHPDFRFFITMDPKHGELSRAMRNRCVEIFMNPDDTGLKESARLDDEAAKDAAAFAGVLEADSLVLDRVEKAVQKDQAQELKEVIWAALEHAPRTLMPMVKRLRRGLDADSKEALILEAFENLAEAASVKAVTEGFVAQACGKKEQLELPDGFGIAQSIIPLRNPYLTTPLLPAAIAAYYAFFTAARKIHEIAATETAIRQNVTTRRLAEMTILEKSASRSSKASSSKKKPSSQGLGSPLFDFLSTIRTILQEWLATAQPSALEAMTAVQEITDIWRDLVRVSSAPTVDDSILQVYLWLSEQWLCRARTILPEQVVAHADQALKAFAIPLRMTTGLSMEVLWSVMRPSVPWSLEKWQDLKLLRGVMVRFDGVASEGRVEDAVAMREGLIRAAWAVVREGADVGGLVEEITKSIEGLEKARIAGLANYATSAFVPAFDILLKLKALRNQELSQDAIRLAHYASRPTTNLLGYASGKDGIRVGYEQVLEDIWNQPADEKKRGVEGVVGGGVVKEMVNVDVSAKKAVIGQLRHLGPELAELAKQFVGATDVVAADQVEMLMVLLWGKVKLTMVTLEQAYTNSTAVSEALEKLEALLFRSTEAFNAVRYGLMAIEHPAHLAPIVKEHFLPVLEAFVSYATTGAEAKLEIVAIAWVHYSLASLKLYVPDCAFDPALKPMIQKSRYHSRRTELTGAIEAERQHELLFTGQDENQKLAILQTQLVDLGQEPADSFIARPKESGMSALQGELTSLLQVVVNSQPHKKLLSSIINKEDGYKEQAHLVQINLTQIAERLGASQHVVYKDIVDPVLGFVYAMKLGLALAVQGAEATKAQGKVDVDSIMDPTHELADTKNVSTEARLFTIRKLAARVETEGIEKLEPSARDGANATFRRLYQDWKRETEEAREKAANDSSLYTYRGEQDDFDLKEFQSMFPDYEENENGDLNEATEKPELTGTKLSQHSELAAKISAHHSAFFADGKELEMGLEDTARFGVDLWKKMAAKQNVQLNPADAEKLLPAILLSLKMTTEWARGTRDAKDYDFYMDENIAEANRLVTIIHATLNRVAHLAEIWPENAVLGDAIEECQQILAFPNSTPVAKFITKVEKLHGILHEWQQVASKEFTAIEHFDAITQLIISWRKLELTTWPRLFEREDENAKQQALGWWFFLYENVVFNPLAMIKDGQNLAPNTRELTQNLANFMGTSSVGQYPHRLSLLQSFEKHVEFLVLGGEKKMEIVLNALRNFNYYHAQYLSTVEEARKEGRKKAEKDVADVVLLASWKDTGILALRESAKRSHHKLYKVIRKYRQKLDNPVLMLLVNMPKLEIVPTIVIDSLELKKFDQQIKDVYGKMVKNWTRRPQRLQDVDAVGRMMLRASKPSEEAIELGEYMDTMAGGVASTVQELQKETPAILSSENKDAIKHLKSRKKKALADTLKELHTMGLTSNPSLELLKKQAALEHILVHAKALESVEGAIEVEGAQKYFSRLVEALIKARAARREPAPDLDANEIKRCGGSLEHLMHIVLEQRGVVAGGLRELKRLTADVEKYQTLASVHVSDLTLVGRETLASAGVAAIRKMVRWMPKMLAFTARLVDIHREFTSADITTIGSEISQWMATAKKLDSALVGEKDLHQDFWQATVKAIVDEAREFFEQVNLRLHAFCSEDANIAYTLGPLKRWLANSTSVNLGSIAEATAMENTILTLDATLEKLSDSILVAMQKLKSEQAALPTDPTIAGWLLTYEKTSSSAITALHMKNVSRKISSAIDFASAVRPLDAASSHAIRTVFASYAPIVENYLAICRSHLQRSTAAHRATTKAAYILCTNAATLFAKGFCQPSEEGDSGGEQQGAPEAGTGLGDGEGAEDISKDVGADEDMSEIAQEKNENQDEKDDIEDEKDAVNMDGEDMEGQTGDKEGSDDEDGDENEDEGMDEEVGDVDDLDPDAVDEKMWDAEEDEELDEKDGGDDVKGQQKKGDEQEARKEENKKEGKKGDEGDEGDEEQPEESEGQDMDDEVKQQDDGEGVEDHIPEVETLDLPEDLNLDQGEESDKEEMDLDGDEDMDELEDGEKEDEEMKDGEGDGKEDQTETFPEIDDQEPTGPTEMEEDKEGEEPQEDDNTEEQGDGVEDEEQEPEGDQPMEDTENLLQTRDEDKSEEAEETAPSEAVGAQGGQDTQDTNEQASAQQEAGEETQADNEKKGKGTENAASNEQDDTAGEASQQEQDPSQQQKGQDDEEAKKESEFRKVGDILEKWHRQRREILNANEEEVDRPMAENMELDDPEFEHLPNEEAQSDAQALGAATEEQAAPLDESMAVDSGEKKPMEAMEDNEEQPEDAQAAEAIEHEKKDQENPDDEETDSRGAGAIIGETKQLPTGEKDSLNDEDLMDLDLDLDSDVDTSMIRVDPSNPSTALSLRTRDEARTLWQHHESNTRTLSASLCEHLRLILAPTQATKMRGDFRTGKRLNMRRILPYIASDYKKDKIWLRRAKPSKRQYHVILAVDDSKSMAEGNSSELALETVALVSKALSSLEVGSIGIVRFGEQVDVVHPFENPFTSDSGVEAFRRFSFAQTKTDVRRMVETSLGLFEKARNAAIGSQAELWQLEIVISDGVCEDHDMLRRLVRKAHEQRVMMVFVIVDSVRENSILELNKVKFEGGEIVTERYLDTFPFGYYLVVKDVRELPSVLAGALRQWFAESVEVGM